MKQKQLYSHLCSNPKCLCPYTAGQVQRFGKKCQFCGRQILAVSYGGQDDEQWHQRRTRLARILKQHTDRLFID